jgi:hypothetical protein
MWFHFNLNREEKRMRNLIGIMLEKIKFVMNKKLYTIWRIYGRIITKQRL